MEAEIARLQAEAAAKDESLNQLKIKAKAFAEAMTGEKKQLEASLAAAKAELADIKVKAKAFADNVRSQIVAEKDRCAALERQVQEKEAALAQVQTGSVDAGAIDAAVAAKATEMQANIDALTQQYTQKHAADERKIAALTEEHARAMQQLQTNAAATAQGSADAAYSQWAAEKAQLELDARNLQAQLQAQLDGLRDTHARDLAHLQKQADAAELQTRELMSQLAAATTSAQQLEAVRAGASVHEETLQTVAGLLQQLVPLATTSDPVALAQALQADVRASSATTQRLEAMVARLEADKAAAEAALESAKAAAAAAQTQLSESSWAASGLESQLATLQGQVRTATEEAVASQQQLAQASARADALQGECNELRLELSHEKSAHKSQSGDLSALQASFDAAKAAWATTEATLAKEKADLISQHDKYTKEEDEKKAKAKQYVQALNSEKQRAVDATAQLTADLEAARKALQEKDGLFEKRMAEIKAKTMDKFAEHERVIQRAKEENDKLTETVKKLEAETKALQAKKKEAEDETMESLKKKRLAAKAETQKLANDLEGIQRRAAMFADVTGTKCVQQTKQIDLLQEKVLESIHAVSHQKKCDLSNLHELCVVHDSPRMSTNLPGPAMGLTKVDDDISRVFDKMTTLGNVTERLCDLMLEEGDLSLKDIVLGRVVKQFSACFAHPAQYTKSDEAGLLHSRSSSSTQPPDSPLAAS
ncbi:hypothetical protein ACHHYP_03416 [Achlya hypogyna]|uniref:Uncharacterized protein n=1 Tax=Achlya hypogyna TaxID=1202772 RepID=A0A1V9ZRB7_ACHHY|nr:hypothetical protein ACHHYP_03416 [Achlya hypogyna]